MKDVSENPEAFGKYMTNVNSNEDMLNGPKEIQSLIDLGKKLDDNKYTVKFKRDLGIVDGRQMLEFEVEETGETFIMYHSKGTGTGVESKGKWVPIKGFAKNGWFIKFAFDPETGQINVPLTNETNPKFNKYGSKTFQQIAESLEGEQQQESTPAKTETGVVSIHGTFRGFENLSGEKLKDMRNQVRGLDNEIIETVENGKKRFTYVRNIIDAWGRDGYMGVTLSFSEDTTETKESLATRLKNLHDKVTGGKVRSGFEVKPQTLNTEVVEGEGISSARYKLDDDSDASSEAASESEIDMISQQMNKVFPSVTVISTQEGFNTEVNKPGVISKSVEGKKILGFTKDGKIILNPSKATLNTAIHEFGHIWIDYLRSKASGVKGSKLLQRGMELVVGTKAYEKAKRIYGTYDSNGNLTNEELVREEALVALIASKGENIANSAKKSRFKRWLNAMYSYIKTQFTKLKDVNENAIKDLTIEDFQNIALADLFSNESIDIDSEVKFDAAFEANTPTKNRFAIIGGLSVDEMIAKGRELGYSEESIK